MEENQDDTVFEQIRMLMDRSGQTAADGVSAFKHVKDSIARVTQESSKINEALEAIEQMILKVRILAINASVEAARAGEQGRGFAIVAQEMGHLAHDIQSGINTISEASRDTLRKVETAIETAEDADEKIELIELSSDMVKHFLDDLK